MNEYQRRQIAKPLCWLKAVFLGLLYLGMTFQKLEAQVVSDSLKPFAYVYADHNNDGRPDHLGQVISVSGVANIKTGVLHPKYLQVFIQNDSTGLSIFNKNILHPFNRGDSLVVTGEIQQYAGLPELYATSYKVFPRGSKVLPKPISLKRALLHPSKSIGVLVDGEGVIVEKGKTQNGKYLKVSVSDSARSKVLVYVSNFHVKAQDFKFDVLNVGDSISFAGIFGEESPDFSVHHIHKLYLRTPDDLTYEGIPRYYLLLGFGILLLIAIVVTGWIVSLRREVRNKTAEIQESLDDKEVLLREIHHRVKNNLSIISGLIELQLDGTDDENVKHVLKDSQSRIYSMAMIHEKLYETESLSSIKLDSYLKDLVEAIHGTFVEYNDSVSLKFDLETALLDIDKVVPCGLLINELVVNAFKHAFKENEHGVLTVELEKKDGKVELTVADNGPGLPEDFSLENTNSLGCMLISTFAAQLEANTKIENRGGANFKFTFNVN